MRRLAVLGALAMEMAFSVLAGTVFGYLLDRYFKTEPVLTIVFLFVGVVVGFVTFVKLWRFLVKKV